jgi:hypothetical protein
MRSVPGLAIAVILAASAMTAACGVQQAGSPAGGSSPSTAAGVAVSPNCTGAPPSSPQNPVITLSAHDNGKSYCITKGTGVLIYLRGSQAVPWSHLKSHSTAMVPRANGHMMLMLGVTGGYFVAAHQGVAVISSSRNPCGPRTAPTGPTTSHKMMCGVAETFQVTVTVVG